MSKSSKNVQNETKAAMRNVPKITRALLFLIVAIILLAIVSWIFLLNQTPARVTWSKTGSWEAPLALILMATLTVGFVLSFLLSLVFIVKQRLAFRSYRKKTDQIHLHYYMMTEAREAHALGELANARSIYQKIIHQNPNNILARINLASTFRDEGNIKEALGVLDKARQTEKHNTELLLLASELNEELNNYTAACDNLALVLKNSPHCEPALEQLVQLKIALKDYETALQHQDTLIKRARGEHLTQLQEDRAEIALSKASYSCNSNAKAYREALNEILKRHRNYPKAEIELSYLEMGARKLNKATKLFSSAYKTTGETSILHTMASIWIDSDNPDKAITSVKNALLSYTQESKTQDSNIENRGQMFLASLLLYLGQMENAAIEIQKVDISHLLVPQDRLAHTLLNGLIASKKGSAPEGLNSVCSYLTNYELLEAGLLFLGSSSDIKHNKPTSRTLATKVYHSA